MSLKASFFTFFRFLFLVEPSVRWSLAVNWLDQIRQAVEAPEGALKDRYDLLLRPCRRYRPCTQMYIWYIWLHFYRLIDICVHRISILFFCILFSFSVSHSNGRAPFPPIEIIRWWPKLREEARSTSVGWKHEDVMMSCAYAAYAAYVNSSWSWCFSCQWGWWNASWWEWQDSLRSLWVRSLYDLVTFTCFTCIDSPDENVPL